jgi:hypothetical protein
VNSSTNQRPQAAPRAGLDLLRARVAFRERSISDVLDFALRFVVVHGRVYTKVALASVIPLAAVSLAAGLTLGWTTTWLIAIPLAIACEIPFTVLASRLVFEDQVRTRDVLRAAIRDGARVAFVRALGAALVVIGLSALIVPGIWLATIFLFLGEVMLLERSSMLQAFGRAQRVASSAASEVVVAMLVLALVPAGAVLLADIAGRAVIGELLQFRPPRPLWTEGGGALATLGLFAQVPYLATARFFLYLNVRTRAEGWDIQTRFAAIAARADHGEVA